MPGPPGATPELAVGALEPEADHQCRKQEVTGLCCWGHGEDVLVGSSEPWSPPFFLPSSSAVCHQHLQHRWKLSVTPMGSETFPSLRLSSGTGTRAQTSCLREQTALTNRAGWWHPHVLLSFMHAKSTAGGQEILEPVHRPELSRAALALQGEDPRTSLALNTSGNCLHPFQEEFPSESWFPEAWSIPSSFPWRGSQCLASEEHQSSGLQCWQGGQLARWLWALLTPKL